LGVNNLLDQEFIVVHNEKGRLFGIFIHSVFYKEKRKTVSALVEHLIIFADKYNLIAVIIIYIYSSPLFNENKGILYKGIITMYIVL
jgi:hypothetical protein